jgi:hypothetical protein
MNDQLLAQAFVIAAQKYVRHEHECEEPLRLEKALAILSDYEATDFEYWDSEDELNQEVAESNGHSHEHGEAVYFDPEDIFTTDQQAAEIHLENDPRFWNWLICEMLTLMNELKKQGKA